MRGCLGLCGFYELFGLRSDPPLDIVDRFDKGDTINRAKIGTGLLAGVDELQLLLLGRFLWTLLILGQQGAVKYTWEVFDSGLSKDRN